MSQQICKTPEVRIKELAEFVSLEYDSIVTPLHEIAAAENIPIFYDNYENAFDGLLIHDNGFYIHLNMARGNREKTPRGRFTLAHELGHYFIDNHRIGLKRGLLHPHGSINHRSAHQKIEKEADYFASCLLMPEERFLKDCLTRKFSFTIIEELAQKYMVSLTACAIRFADIGNHPILIVYCENNRIVWKWRSRDFPYWYLADKNGVIPEDTLVGEYFKTGEGQKRTEQIWAADWFECYRYEDEDNRIYEHFIPHNNKALSIIWED